MDFESSLRVRLEKAEEGGADLPAQLRARPAARALPPLPLGAGRALCQAALGSGSSFLAPAARPALQEHPLQSCRMPGSHGSIINHSSYSSAAWLGPSPAAGSDSTRRYCP